MARLKLNECDIVKEELMKEERDLSVLDGLLGKLKVFKHMTDDMKSFVYENGIYRETKRNAVLY